MFMFDIEISNDIAAELTWQGMLFVRQLQVNKHKRNIIIFYIIITDEVFFYQKSIKTRTSQFI